MNNEQKSVAYIIGNSYGAIAQLPGVYTIDQFFSAVFENGLPEHRSWIIGQGIHDSVKEVLSLCKKYRSDIYFSGVNETVFLEKKLSENIFSKFSQMMKALAQRLGIHR